MQKLTAQTTVLNSVLPKVYQNSFNAPAKVGDNVSELFLGKVINHPTLNEAYVSNFRGKLLILDFWNTFCSVCIKSFPKLDSLQSRYKDKLVILPVGFDGMKKGSIEDWVKRRMGTNYGLRSLPTAIQAPADSVLFKMFPTQGFPYEIWIDSNGVVIGMTDHTFVNSDNIKKIITGEDPELIPKRTIRHHISGCDSNMDNITIDRTTRLDIGSRLTGYIDSIAGGFSYSLQCDSAFGRLSNINLTVVELYRNAYNIIDSSVPTDDVMEKKVIIIENGKPFYKRRKDFFGVGGKENYEFRKNSLYCYDLILPKTYCTYDAAKIMIQDLDRYFNIRSSVEKKQIKCLSLIRTSSKEKFKAKFEIRIPDPQNDPEDVKVRSITSTSFVELLNNLIDPIVVDKTNYYGKIDLDIKMNKKYSLKELKIILNRYDLDLIEEVNSVSFLILEAR
ncbi:TlpA family protein disulfide reductase [Pseudoflavitalea rhizosphaerae]|uniref:TlpA family protein disulfide reductase n=1 Tax=Pseudoflavitalea rhizosphaerae TaxID=1884793 RepID=UPI0013DFA494|nr:TlpA disulfide reductase family protein [Pseudoflavitalea rhizosphaerae]